MRYETLDITQEGPIAHIRLNRPDKRNSLPSAFWHELPHAVAALDRTGTVRAAILYGAGAHFCAGIDVSVFAANPAFSLETPRARDNFIAFGRQLLAAVASLETARFPVIAAIHGACLGAGMELAAACDLRFAAEDAQFRIEEINIGMMADLGNLQRAARQMPEAIARELAYTGATLTGARAAAIGFANAALPDQATLMAAAQEAASAIAARNPLAIRASKDALNYARDHSIADSLERGMVMNAAVLSLPDLQATFTARQARRAPKYEDLAPL
jgi:enoyl-CoA hydratase